MVSLTALWLPIILSAVLVFAASALVWTVLKVHDGDWAVLPAEERIIPALRDAAVAPGQYYFPAAMKTAAGDAAAAESLRGQPTGYVFINRPTALDMRRSIAFGFLHQLAIVIIVAYLAGRTLPAGADYLAVFRVVGTAGFLGFGAAHLTYANWFSHSWSSAWKQVAEGFAYGLIMAGVFGWLWPA
jgi:hypothetical protein